MHLDVTDLRKFYYRSAMGRAVQTVIRDKLRGIWPDEKGRCVVGFGFAAPLLRPFMGEARRVIALMPGPQGVMAWPAGEPNRSVLCAETLWPVPPGGIDRLVMLHGLETSEHPTALLEEAWSALAPSGKAVFIVPHRGGAWARADKTPFGFGRPYSTGQLETQLKKHRFQTERVTSALYQPPDPRKFWRKTASFWERAGQRIPWITAGGVLVVEATKQVAAPTRPGLPEAVRKPLKALEGIAGPAAPEPSRRSTADRRPATIAK